MFTESELNSIINEFIFDNAGIVNLDENQIKAIKKTYYDIANENNIISKTKEEQKSVVTGIAIDVARGAGENERFNRWADNKHMSYFDNFLEDGARGDIQEQLNKYNIPTDILKPIRKNTDYSNTQFVNGKEVTIQQFTDVDDDGYRYVSQFDIFVDGVRVYHFSAEQNTFSERVRENFIEMAQNIYYENGDFSVGETITSRKVNTPNYGYVEETYSKNNGEVTTRKRYAKGTVINGVKVGGRFMNK